MRAITVDQRRFKTHADMFQTGNLLMSRSFIG